MSIFITGASGLIGREFMRSAASRGLPVIKVVRRKAGPGEISWDPQAGLLDARALEGAMAVVHLSGEPVVSGRWTREKKQRILESRERSTDVLATTLATLRQPPPVFLSASAIGIYGSRADEPLDESSPPGTGFLADVCRHWEAATLPASNAGIRVVHLRIGVALSRESGALRQMLPVFRMGLGGRLGDGRQWFPWVGLQDVIGAMWHAIDHAEIAGALNIVAPQPVTNAEFTRALAARLQRPAFAHLPAPVLRLLLGEIADGAVLASTKVVPKRLMDTGYQFAAPTLDSALADLR